MARNITLPGGYLTIVPDPVKRAQEEAELRLKQQAPDIEASKLALAFQQLMRQSQSEQARTAEEARYHTGTLAESAASRAESAKAAAAQLAETTRYHAGEIEHGQAALQETAADRAAREKQAANALRAGQLGDLITHLGPQLAQTPGALEAVMTAYGAPEYGQAMAGVKAENLRKRGMGIAELNKAMTPEKFGVVTAGLKNEAGQPDTELSNAAWTAYKAQHGDKAAAAALAAPIPTTTAPAAPVSAGTTTPTADVLKVAGAQPTFSPVPLSTLGAAAPELVRTEDRGLVKPSMGIVGPGGGTLPIPGATPGKYGEAEPTATPPPTTTTTVAAPPAATPTPTIGQRFGALIAGAGTPAPPPAPAGPSFLSFNNQPIPISVGLAPGPIEPPTPEELERRRQALATVAR